MRTVGAGVIAMANIEDDCLAVKGVTGEMDALDEGKSAETYSTTQLAENASGSVTEAEGGWHDAAYAVCEADEGKQAVSGDSPGRAAVFFVGNRLMLDDGVAPAAYDELRERYAIPDNVELFDVGCMSMDMLPYVRDCDLVLTVDAVDGTEEEPGTVFRFPPDAMARAAGQRSSLHDLKLADLFDAALLLGYEAEGFCVGMQVENSSPAEFTVGLTPKVHAAVPLLVETVAAELVNRGFNLTRKTGD